MLHIQSGCPQALTQGRLHNSVQLKLILYQEPLLPSGGKIRGDLAGYTASNPPTPATVPSGDYHDHSETVHGSHKG